MPGPSRASALPRLALRIAVVGAAAYALSLLFHWAQVQADEVGHGDYMLGVIAGLVVAYAVLIAVPYVPGVEIGIGLLMMRGAEIAPYVYAATVLGLMLAFAAGYLGPRGWLKSLLADLGLRRARALLDRLDPMTRDERLAALDAALPRWARPLAGRGRYLLLALLFNIPGNGVLGGGGGIAFAAGFSGLFRPWVTLLVVAIAVLPVPLWVWLWGGSGVG